MNSQRARVWRKAALFSAIGFALVWIGSGGLVVEHKYRVDALPYVGGGPDLCVDLVNRPASGGIALVLRYNTDLTRLGVRVTYVTHHLLSDPELTLDWCNLILPDGTVIDLTRQLRAGWKPEPWQHGYQSVDWNSFQSKPSLKSEVTVDDCLPADTSFVFRMKGRLCSGGVAVEEIDETQSYRPLRRTRVRVVWLWLDV